MLNAEFVTQKNSTSQIKKKYHYLQVFIIIFKGQLREREIKRERQREIKGEYQESGGERDRERDKGARKAEMWSEPEKN